MLVARASTIHNAATWVLENHPWDFAAVLYDGIELFCQRFMDYHPPRQPATSQQDFEVYQHVVTAACCFHDMMLGRLLQLAGSDTNVLLVSDHGYQSGETRPSGSPATSQGVEAAHRAQGIWVLHGPRVARGAGIVGASLLDVAPTSLMLMGVPSGVDMEGRPWVEAIADAGEAELETDRIISWDSIAGPDGMHPPQRPVEVGKDDESREAIEHLLELGYVEPTPSAAASAAVARTREENQFNLARALMTAGQVARAIEFLEPLVQANRTRWDYVQTLFRAYIALSQHEQARDLVQKCIAQGAPATLTHLALGMLELAERRPAAALEHLRQATAGHAASGEVHVLIGQGYLRLRRWNEAEEAFSRALEIDPDNAAAWHGRTVVSLAHEQNEQAIELALRAVELRPDYPEAHYHLGLALVGVAKPHEASIALKRCLALRPGMLAPYRALADLYEGPLKDPAQALAYRRDARAIILQRRMDRPRA
jgi:tetratricopeptide (TPR) repeat protein